MVGVDDDWSADIASAIEQHGRKVERISVRRPVTDGYYAEGSAIFEAVDANTRQVADLAGIGSLRGTHNAQNAAAAIASARLLGLSDEAIEKGLKSFPGLAHRMEEVAKIGHVLFVNDSKATNADAAEKALSSFEHIYWILGGKPKTGGIDSLEPYFGRIARAYLLGAASDVFAETLDGKVSAVKCGTMDRAVAAAAEDAARDEAQEPVVLLSPACASFDQYRNFEKRGDHFRELVLARAAAGVPSEVR